jgi:hypothetical protein
MVAVNKILLPGCTGEGWLVRRRQFLIALSVNGLGILVAVLLAAAFGVLLSPKKLGPMSLILLAAAVPLMACPFAPIAAVLTGAYGHSRPLHSKWPVPRRILNRVLWACAGQLAAGGAFAAIFIAWAIVRNSIYPHREFGEGLLLVVLLLAVELLLGLSASILPCIIGAVLGTGASTWAAGATSGRPLRASVWGLVGAVASVAAYLYTLKITLHPSKGWGPVPMFAEIITPLAIAGLCWACSAGLWSWAFAARRPESRGKGAAPTCVLAASATTLFAACATWSVWLWYLPYSVR